MDSINISTKTIKISTKNIKIKNISLSMCVIPVLFWLHVILLLCAHQFLLYLIFVTNKSYASFSSISIHGLIWLRFLYTKTIILPFPQVIYIHLSPFQHVSVSMHVQLCADQQGCDPIIITLFSFDSWH